MKKEIFTNTARIGLLMATTLIFISALQQQQTISSSVSAQVNVPTTEISPAVNQTLQPPTENATNITSRAPENMTSE